MAGFNQGAVLDLLYDARFHLELNFTTGSYQNVDGDVEARRRLAGALGLEFVEPPEHSSSVGGFKDGLSAVYEDELMVRIIKAIKRSSAKGNHDLAVLVETSQIVETCSVGAMQWVRALSIPTPKSGGRNFYYVERDATYKRAHWAVAWAIDSRVGKPDDEDDETLEPEDLITGFNDTSSKEEVVEKFTEAIVAIEAGRGREIWARFNKFYPPIRKNRWAHSL